MKRKLENYKDALRDLNRANDLRPDSSWILGCVSVNFKLFFPNSSTSTGGANKLKLDDNFSHELSPVYTKCISPE